MSASTVSFLEGIVQRRKEDISAIWGILTPADRERLASSARSPLDLAAALSAGDAVAVIAEVKKASPSAGPIAPDMDASKQAMHYQEGGAAAVSVLTEPTAFLGSFGDLSDVADAVRIPVLCKDFVIDLVQMFVARGHGADAVLLMVSVLGRGIQSYLDLAQTLKLQCLVEVVSRDELDIALRAGATLVAVNSRDLHSLDVDPARAARVIAQAKRLGMTVVSASGMRTRSDVEAAAAAGADAVLVGEALMRHPYPEDLLAELTGVAKTAPPTSLGEH